MTTRGFPYIGEQSGGRSDPLASEPERDAGGVGFTSGRLTTALFDRNPVIRTLGGLTQCARTGPRLHRGRRPRLARALTPGVGSRALVDSGCSRSR